MQMRSVVIKLQAFGRGIIQREAIFRDTIKCKRHGFPNNY